ncbi:MAG: helix-turn-helix domain-containing protein [Amphiplicatus sp.]
MAAILEKPAPEAAAPAETRRLRLALRRARADIKALTDKFAVAFDGDDEALDAILDEAEDAAARAGEAAYGVGYLELETIEAIEAGENPIAAIRRERGLTQAELAAKAGFSPIYISKLERGERPLSDDAADAIALALSVWPDNLRAE